MAVYIAKGGLKKPQTTFGINRRSPCEN